MQMGNTNKKPDDPLDMLRVFSRPFMEIFELVDVNLRFSLFTDVHECYGPEANEEETRLE